MRHDLLEALRGDRARRAERTIAETARQLREEAEVLDAAVDAALEELGGGPAVSASRAARQPRRPCAGWCCGGWPSEARRRALRARGRRDLALGGRGSKSLDLGGGLRAVVEYGTLRFTRAPRAEAAPDPVALPVPGRARFGDWEVEAALGRAGEVAIARPSWRRR